MRSQRRRGTVIIVLMGTGMLILILLLAVGMGGSGSRAATRSAVGNTPGIQAPPIGAVQPTPGGSTPSKNNGLAVPIEIQRQVNVIIIPVASESMKAQINGIAKLEIMQTVVGSLISATSDNLRIGLLNYATTGTPPTCQSISLRSPPGTDKKKIVDNLKGIQARGGADIAGALSSVEIEFRPGEENYVILLADTIDSCSGDVVRVAESLQQSDVAATVFVMGLAPSPEGLDQLNRIAFASRGRYYQAANGAELNSALLQVLDNICGVADPGRVYLNVGIGLVGGTRFDDAIRKFSLAVQAQPSFVEGYAWWGKVLSLKAQGLDGPDRAVFFAQANEKAIKAMALAQVKSNPSGEAMALNVLGDSAYERHDYVGAIEQYKAALARDASPGVAFIFQQSLAKAQAALELQRPVR